MFPPLSLYIYTTNSAVSLKIYFMFAHLAIVSLEPFKKQTTCVPRATKIFKAVFNPAN